MSLKYHNNQVRGYKNKFGSHSPWFGLYYNLNTNLFLNLGTLNTKDNVGIVFAVGPKPFVE